MPRSRWYCASLSVGYDLVTASFSVADMVCDYLVLLQFYTDGRPVFFALSLVVMLLAHATYACLFTQKYVPDHTTNQHGRIVAVFLAALPVFLEVTLSVRRERADCACPDFVEAALCVFLHLLMQAARGCTAHHAQASARATMPALRQRIAARGAVAKPSELSEPLLECSQRRRSLPPPRLPPHRTLASLRTVLPPRCPSRSTSQPSGASCPRWPGGCAGEGRSMRSALQLNLVSP